MKKFMLFLALLVVVAGLAWAQKMPENVPAPDKSWQKEAPQPEEGKAIDNVRVTKVWEYSGELKHGVDALGIAFENGQPVVLVDDEFGISVIGAQGDIRRFVGNKRERFPTFSRNGMFIGRRQGGRWVGQDKGFDLSGRELCTFAEQGEYVSVSELGWRWLGLRRKYPGGSEMYDDTDTLILFDQRGKVLRRIPSPYTWVAKLAPLGQILYVKDRGASDNRLVAYSGLDGRLLWEEKTRPHMALDVDWWGNVCNTEWRKEPQSGWGVAFYSPKGEEQKFVMITPTDPALTDWSGGSGEVQVSGFGNTALLNRYENGVYLIDKAQGRVLWQHQADVAKVTLSEDGQFVLVNSREVPQRGWFRGHVYLYNRVGKIVWQHPEEIVAVVKMAIRGNYFALSGPRTVHLYKIEW